MSMGLSQDRGVALRQFLLYHPAVVQNVLRASGLMYVRAHDPMVTMEALVETDDEFDVDAPSVSRPTRGEPLEPQRPAPPPAVGREVVETGVGADLAPGVFNARIPRDWQVAMVESFVAKCPAPVSVVVCGDESTSDVVETLRGVLPAACSVHEGSAAGVADLARLAWSDLVIPSVSSFSLTASFLGDGLYCWPLEHLHESGGWRSIWGFEPEQEGGPTSRAQDVAPTNGRGIAQSSSPHWPDWAIEYIVRRAQLRQRESDLIYYGVVRDPSSLSAERRDS